MGFLREDSERQSGERAKDQISESQSSRLRNLAPAVGGGGKPLRIFEKSKATTAGRQEN